MCEIPSTILTTKIPTASTIVRFLSKGAPESSKRLIAAVCAAALVLISLVLVGVMAYQAIMNWTVSSAIATAFTFTVGFVAALAGAIYRKPEPDDPAPNKEKS